jgi:hypothetical protein
LKQTIEKVEKAKLTSLKKQSVLKTIFQPHVLKPLILINLFNVLQILTGTYLTVFYAVDILHEICEFDGADITTFQGAVVISLIRFLLTIVYCYLLLKCRRRVLYLSSCFFSGVFAMLLSLFLYYKYTIAEKDTLTDLIIKGLLILLYIAFNSPLMLLPGIMVGELLPSHVRHWSGIIFTAFNLMLFGIAKTFPLMHQTFRIRGLFAMFASASFFAAILFYWLLPETKNRSLSDIEDYYSDSNWIWQKRNKKLIDTAHS